MCRPVAAGPGFGSSSTLASGITATFRSTGAEAGRLFGLGSSARAFTSTFARATADCGRDLFALRWHRASSDGLSA